jgi:hypothetical protein
MSQQQPEPPDALKSNTVEARILKQKIWDRLWLSDEHFMGVLVGREGSGKSWTGIKMAETCDPTFEGWRVMFDPAEFLEQLQEWKEENNTKGKMVVIDEAGVGVGVRSWYEKDQILLNQVLQLIRSENMGVIFTLPRLEELDSQTEGRLHAFMEMTDIDRGSWAKLKWFNWDPTRDGRNETYREYPKLRVDGHQRQIKRLKLSPPSEEIIAPYEDRKDAFQSEQYQQALDEMEDEADDEMTVKEVAMQIADGQAEQFVSRHGQTKEPYINKQLIRAEHELSHSDAQAVKSLLERQFTETELEEYA